MTTINPRVVDLSHWDDVQDKFAGAVKFGIWGVINKTTQYVGNHDKSFDWRRKPAADAGLLYGAYHFLRAGRIQEQAEWFLHNIGDPTGLLIAVDHERENDKGEPATLAELKQWLTYVHGKIGRWPWLYSGNVIKEQLGISTDPFWKQIKLWLPQYSNEPVWPRAFDRVSLWQYTGDGRGLAPHNVPGIVIHGKGIDINHFAGTREELAA